MFDRLKQLKQIKELRDSLEQEKVETEKNGVKVIMNGKMEVEDIKLNPDLECSEQEKILKECLGDAMKKIQALAAQKMSQMSGF